MVRGIKMKHIYNIIFTIVLAMISNQTYAAIQMCSANDAVSVVIDASIAPTNVITYPAVKSWKATFSYGTLQGQYACVQGDNNSGYNDKVYNVLPNTVVNGAGVKCIKISHPVMSKWLCNGYDNSCSSNPSWVYSMLNTTWGARYSLINAAN